MEPDAWKAESRLSAGQEIPHFDSNRKWLQRPLACSSAKTDTFTHTWYYIYFRYILILPSRQSGLNHSAIWHFDKNCVGIFHFSQFWNYLIKITRKDVINFTYIPCFYETFVLCVLDSSYCDAHPPPYIYIYIYMCVCVWSVGSWWDCGYFRRAPKNGHILGPGTVPQPVRATNDCHLPIKKLW
jgi:hypothetical protein